MGKDKEDIEDSSSSSSSDDSSDEEEEMSVDTSEIDRLEMQVRSSPYNFAFHEQYIAALSKAGRSKFAELRTAREDLSSKFPLPEGQWLAWVRDESQAATTKEDKEKVIELYKTALTDYLSVPLQISYAAFVESIAFSDSKGGTPDTASAKRVRDTYENGLTSVGLHMVDGARLWAAYRTFEQRVLASMAGQSEGDKNKQIEKIRALYRRQVAVPHTGIEETYADFVEWEASLTPQGPNPDSNAALQTQYKNAIAAFEERKGYEDAIAGSFLPSNPDYEKLPSWREYLAFEESKGDPSRIQCLYERVLKSYFLVADLWVYYAAYLEKTFSKMPQIIFPVYARAVRNCTWSGDLWGSYIRSLEKANQPAATIEGVFETALVSGIQQENDFVAVWNSYIDFRRRIYSNTVKNNAKEAEASATQIREAFQRYMDYFTQYFAGSASVNNIILHWARLEANVLQNGAAARKQYGDYIHHHNSDYLIWSEWISCERRFGHPDMARQLYRRAAQITSMTNPDTQRVRVDWISFEREAGDIESLVSCQAVCAVQEAELYARMEAAALQAQARAPREGKRKPTDDAGGKNKRAKPEGGSRFEDKRRKRNDEHENGHAKKTEKAEDTKDTKDTKSEEPKKKETNVVHVSNLPWKVQEPELKELFEKYGAVKGVRLPRQNDKSMGYAFVEFESEASAQAAMALDGTNVMNRPLRVTIANNALPDTSRSFVAPPSRRPAEEGSAESGNDAAPKRFSDENTLFVSNLPFSCTADDIKKTFAAVADAIRDVRLATDSKDGNGRCKGFGYVEFTDKEGFERGLALTGLLIKGRKINTSIAEPPKPVSVRQRRDQPDRPAKPESPADENKPVVRKGMNVPRALKLKVASAPKKETNKPTKEQETKETTETKETKETATTKDVEMKDTDTAAPKSNDFFKNLMKK